MAADRRKKRRELRVEGRTVIDELLAAIGEGIGGFFGERLTPEKRGRQIMERARRQTELEALRRIPLEDEGVTRPQRLPQDNGRTGMPSQRGVGGPTPLGQPSAFRTEPTAEQLGRASFPKSGTGGAFEPRVSQQPSGLDLNEIVVDVTDVQSALRASVPPPDLIGLQRNEDGFVVDKDGIDITDSARLTRFAQFEFGLSRATAFLKDKDEVAAFLAARGQVEKDIAANRLTFDKEKDAWQRAHDEGKQKEVERAALALEALEKDKFKLEKKESAFRILALIMANKNMLQVAKDTGLIGQLGQMFEVDLSSLAFPVTPGTLSQPKRATL